MGQPNTQSYQSIAYQMQPRQQPLMYRPVYQQSRNVYPTSYQAEAVVPCCGQNPMKYHTQAQVQPQQPGCCGGSWLSNIGALCSPIVHSPCPPAPAIPAPAAPQQFLPLPIPMVQVPQLQLPMMQKIPVSQQNGCGSNCQTACQPCTQQCCRCCYPTMFANGCSRLKRSPIFRSLRVCS
uniref:Cysteine-rich transmembrane CYSTM domain-containing protein n=1 Tax=Syphacia muris TaxID=451379 RepID=A0A0N5AQC0_9BILA